MIKFMERVQRATFKDMEHKTIFELFASAAEELGEIANEMTIEEHTYGHDNKQVKEGVKGESVDLMICALALFFARGGTIDGLIAYGNKKLDKWEASQK